MANTVSRSGDNGKSTPVNVPAMDGYIEEHKADPKDLAAARTPVASGFKSTQDIEVSEWIENLMDSATNFSSPKGAFKLRPKGVHGSVQTLDEALRRDPFVLRAVQRGKIRFLTDAEAMQRIEDLVDEDDGHHDHQHRLEESLGANASENNGMYKIPLPDEAEPKGPSQTYQQVWANSQSAPENGHKH